MNIQKKTEVYKKVSSNFLQKNPSVGPLSDYKYQQYLFTQGKKRCCSCRKELPISNFFRKSNGLDTAGGYSTACKHCYLTFYQPRTALYKQRKEFLAWMLPYLNTEYVVLS